MTTESEHIRELLGALSSVKDTWRASNAKSQYAERTWPGIDREIQQLISLDFSSADVSDIFGCFEALSLALEESYWYYFPRVLRVLDRNSLDPRSGIVFERLTFNLEAGDQRASLAAQLDRRQRERVLQAVIAVEARLFGTGSTANAIKSVFDCVKPK